MAREDASAIEAELPKVEATVTTALAALKDRRTTVIGGLKSLLELLEAGGYPQMLGPVLATARAKAEAEVADLGRDRIGAAERRVKDALKSLRRLWGPYTEWTTRTRSLLVALGAELPKSVAGRAPDRGQAPTSIRLISDYL